MKKEERFSVQEAINKNIEKHQNPNFKKHSTLKGWCQMNYPKILENPIYKTRPQPKNYDYDNDFLYQKEKQNQYPHILVKPFSNMEKKDRYKISTKHLTTTLFQNKQQIVQQLENENHNIKPIKANIGKEDKDPFHRKIQQIGEITYQLKFQNEEKRHLKTLPQEYITEQNLLDILNEHLTELSLYNHTWIKNDIINKIGYFATNIKILNLTRTIISDEVLYELAISCENLRQIDISHCEHLTEEGIHNFLRQKTDLNGVRLSNNPSSVTDYSLEPLQNIENLRVLDVSYNNQLTESFYQYLASKQMSYLNLMELETFDEEVIVDLLKISQNSLEYLNLSFISSQKLGKNVLQQIGKLTQIRSLSLLGCKHITSFEIYEMANFSIEGLCKLQEIQLNQIDIDDSALISLLSKSPDLKYVDLSQTNVSMNSLSKIIESPSIERVILNLTSNISNQEYEEFIKSNPEKSQLFIKDISMYTDPQDDGLRMPYVNVNNKPKKAKKKKKK